MTKEELSNIYCTPNYNVAVELYDYLCDNDNTFERFLNEYDVFKRVDTYTDILLLYKEFNPNSILELPIEDIKTIINL